LGLTREEMQRGLAGCQPPKMRLQLRMTHGVGVLDDCYNANADSVWAALQTLRDLPATSRRIAVLGDMAELGPHTAAAHEEAARRAAELGVDALVAVGSMAGVTATAARAAGMKLVQEHMDIESAIEAVKNLVKPGDVVLLKASRAARLERLVKALER
jgi:UDP-N-acetylmuramoyl-tripeptide--D-alanyl-D-alanine ligase